MKEEDCRGQELCEQGGGPGLSLIPYPVLPTSLISPTVYVDVKHHDLRAEVRSCVYREVGPGLSFFTPPPPPPSPPRPHPHRPPSLISHMVSVHVEHLERIKKGGGGGGLQILSHAKSVQISNLTFYCQSLYFR